MNSPISQDITDQELRRQGLRYTRLCLIEALDKVVSAVAKLEAPVSFVEADRAGKALITLSKAASEIYRHEETTDEGEPMDDEDALHGREAKPPYDAIDVWRDILERKLNRIRDARAASADFARPDGGTDSLSGHMAGPGARGPTLAGG